MLDVSAVATELSTEVTAGRFVRKLNLSAVFVLLSVSAVFVLRSVSAVFLLRSVSAVFVLRSVSAVLVEAERVVVDDDDPRRWHGCCGSGFEPVGREHHFRPHDVGANCVVGV